MNVPELAEDEQREFLISAVYEGDYEADETTTQSEADKEDNKVLPATGASKTHVILAAAAISMLAGNNFVAPKLKKENQ